MKEVVIPVFTSDKLQSVVWRNITKPAVLFMPVHKHLLAEKDQKLQVLDAQPFTHSLTTEKQTKPNCYVRFCGIHAYDRNSSAIILQKSTHVSVKKKRWSFTGSTGNHCIITKRLKRTHGLTHCQYSTQSSTLGICAYVKLQFNKLKDFLSCENNLKIGWKFVAPSIDIKIKMKLKRPIGGFRQASNKYGSSAAWQSYKGKLPYYGGSAGKLAARQSRISG